MSPRPVYLRYHLRRLRWGAKPKPKNFSQACRTKGFFLLDLQHEPNGERLLQDIGSLFAIAEEVMALSLEEKTKYHQNPPSILYGYKAKGVMKNEKGQPDWCEFYNVVQDDILGNEPPRANPQPVQDNRKTLKSFLHNAYPIIQLILGILDVQLGLPQGTLASLQRPVRASGTVIRMIRYPPKAPIDQGTSLLGHTDFGTITMLCNVLGGLQILPPGAENDDANWEYVKAEPNCAIINLGDALVEWTGGILRSNQHRVVAPPGKQKDYTRFSVAYLVRPERKISMKRLVGGYIPSAAEDGKEETELTAEEWEVKKAMALKAGSDCAKSRGGRELEALPLKIN